MFDLAGLFLPFLSFLVFRHADPGTPPTKSVAIVGAGSAGLAMLRALVDIQDQLDSPLDIVLYEQRRDVGGVWLPDLEPVHPPVLPETPLYPLLHTNTPVPVMTFPDFPFPPWTPLYPSHEYVEEYHRDFASKYNLWPYILVNHTVVSASWVGTSEVGQWDIVVAKQDGHTTRRSFDHLVVANGHNHYPHVPIFPGQNEWLQRQNGPSGRPREILHSIFYRGPRRYANQTVVVVGSGASGLDVVLQVSLYAKKLYFSCRSRPLAPPPDSAVLKPEIAYFTPDAIVFADGSRAYGVDAVVLGTGYDLRVPFLESTGELSVKPSANERGPGLTTNLQYLFPLHQHIFSLSPSYPTNALAFIGLPIIVFNCPTNFAQSIYAARAIVNASCMGPHEMLLHELDEHEDGLRSQGYDPYHVGHRFVTVSQYDYQEHLIDMLKERGTIPDDGEKYVRPWRRESIDVFRLKRGWVRVEELGLQREWLKGVETEGEWADMMQRLDAWQEEWEIRHGLVFPDEPTLF